MRRRDVIAFQGHWQHVEPAIQHAAVEVDVELIVVAQEIEVGDSRRGHEVRHEHRAELAGEGLNPQPLDDALEAAPHAIAQIEQSLVEPGLLEHLDRGQAGRHRQRMTVEGAGEEHAAVGRVEVLHKVAPAADRCAGVAIGHRLAQRRQVRSYAADGLIAAQGVPKASDHLVEHEHDPVLARQRPEAREEFLLGHHHADRVGDGLQNHGRDVVAALSHHALQRLQVVEFEHDQLRVHVRQDARRQRVQPTHAVRRRDDVGEQMIVPAVEMPLELDDRPAAGRPARNAHRVIGGLGA